MKVMVRMTDFESVNTRLVGWHRNGMVKFQSGAQWDGVAMLWYTVCDAQEFGIMSSRGEGIVAWERSSCALVGHVCF